MKPCLSQGKVLLNRPVFLQNYSFFKICMHCCGSWISGNNLITKEKKNVQILFSKNLMPTFRKYPEPIF